MLEENWLDGVYFGGFAAVNGEIVGGFAAVKEDFLEADAILIKRGGAVLFLPHGDVGGVVGGAVDLVEERGGEGRMAVVAAAVLVVCSVVIPRIHEIFRVYIEEGGNDSVGVSGEERERMMKEREKRQR